MSEISNGVPYTAGGIDYLTAGLRSNNARAEDIAIFDDTDKALVVARNTIVYNVRDFGAIGDGALHPLSEEFSSLSDAQSVYPFVTSLSQSIDWAGWQKAALALNGSGGTLFGGLGSYIFSDTLYVQSFTRVVGMSRDVCTLKRADNTFSANSLNSNNGRGAVVAVGSAIGTGYTGASRGQRVSFIDITIDGNKANQTFTGITSHLYAAAHGIYCRHTDYVHVERCRVINTPQNGIFGPGGGHWRILNSDWIGCGSTNTAFDVGAGLTKNAISVGASSQDAYLAYAIDYLIQGNYVDGARDEGIMYGYAKDVIIDNNHVYNSIKKGIEGDHATGGGIGTPGNVIVTNNYVDGSGEEGIGISNGDNQHVQVAYNQVRNTAWDGIKVAQDNESTFVITNNIVDTFGGGYTASAASYHGIYCKGHRITIAENDIYSGVGNGIAIVQGRRIKVCSNAIERVKGIGISVNIATASTVNAISFTDNMLDVIDSHGIQVIVNGTVTNLLIDANLATEVGLTGASQGSADGISITGASTLARYLTVTNNHITDQRTPPVMGYGLNLNNSSSVTQLNTSGNTLRPSAFAGFGGVDKVSTDWTDAGDNRWADTGSRHGMRTQNSNYTVQIFDRVIWYTGTWTLTLPLAKRFPSGQPVKVVNAGAGTISIATTSGQTLNGITSIAAGQSAEVQSGGATDQWFAWL